MLPALLASSVLAPIARSTFVKTLLSGGFFLAVATGAYFVFRKVILAMKRDSLLKQVGENSKDGLALGYASRIYGAMISGHEWWNDWFGDGTDEEAIYTVAREMNANQVPFMLVAAKYKVLYDRDLYANLTTELSAAEMQQFQQILASGLGDVPAPPPVLINELLITTTSADVLDEKLQPVSQVGPRTRLGAHDETMILPGNRVLHGFMYQNQRRYVAAPAVQRVPLAA